MAEIRNLCLVLIGVIVVSVFSIGCGGTDLASEFRDANKSNAAKVRGFYLVYKMQNKMKAPKSKKELLEFMKGNPQAYAKNFELQGIEIDEVDGFFVSENDDQELRIKWGMDGVVTPPIVFEVEGKNGEVLVVGETVRTMSKEEADQLWKDKKKNVKIPGTQEGMN